MSENYINAEQDYMGGMKYKDIAAKYGVTMNTVKSWKQRYEWGRDKKSAHTKSEKVCTQNKRVRAPLDDGTKETLQNDELTPEQQMFCIYYSRTFNATQSYLKAYGCSYDVANAEGYKQLVKPCVRAEIERLKDIKRQQIVASEYDIVELQMRIAFSDMGDFTDFKGFTVMLKDSKSTDTQLVKKVSMSKEGVSILLEDRQKAIDWLTKYFLLHPDDKYKAEFDKKRAEVKDDSAEKVLQNMQTLVGILQNPVPNRNIDDLEEAGHEHTGATE